MGACDTGIVYDYKTMLLWKSSFITCNIAGFQKTFQKTFAFLWLLDMM